MKKALFIVALYLVPFLSVKANIFEDGTIDLEIPKNIAVTSATCYNTHYEFEVVVQVDGADVSSSALLQLCQSEAETHFFSAAIFSDSCKAPSGTWINDSRINVEYGYKHYDDCIDNSTSIQIALKDFQYDQAKSCPPDGLPSYSAQYSGQTQGDFKCFDPEEANQKDSCNASSGNEYLTIGVSAPTGCFPQSDGSICKYDAVDIGGGNQVYAMDLEGDCYSDNDLPDLDGTPETNPVGGECVSYGGGVLGCPEDPSNVCSSGSAYAGGSINDCQTGCGMVNDQFLCIDQDTDGDGLADYNDPDIDGDGVPNDDDLDGDGDGVDDPINGGNGTGSGGKIDLGPVVNELKKLNKQFESQGKPESIDKDKQLTKKNDDFKTTLEEIRDKDAETMGYVDSLSLTSSAGLVSALPSNGCTNYTFNPGGYSVSLDTCLVADKVRPILTWLFGLLTAWHIFFLINKTLREGV